MKKEIPGYEGLYAADTDGTIWSLLTTTARRAGPLKPYVNTGGYLKVNLFKNKKRRHEYVHRLVARTFIPNPQDFKIVYHKDTNPANNCADNLEWCDQRYNIAESHRLGNQNKDCRVIAFSMDTGDMRTFGNMAAAGAELFGRRNALWYHCKTKGPRFDYKNWKFEVRK